MKPKAIAFICSFMLLLIVFSGCESVQPTPLDTETEVIEDTQEIEPTEDIEETADIEEDMIRQAFSEKYEKPLNDVELNVTEKSENHMRGTVTLGEGPGNSGMFLAAKVEDKWVIVHDGQGTFTCNEVEPFNFPPEMIEDCFEENI